MLDDGDGGLAKTVNGFPKKAKQQKLRFQNTYTGTHFPFPLTFRQPYFFPPHWALPSPQQQVPDVP